LCGKKISQLVAPQVLYKVKAAEALNWKIQALSNYVEKILLKSNVCCGFGSATYRNGALKNIQFS
jgi:hypothetical protein